MRVYGAGVNRADPYLPQGRMWTAELWRLRKIGLEVRAEVEAVGVHTAKSFKLGDRGMGIVGGGGSAEIARLNAGMAILMPAGLTFAEAAAIPETFVTAHWQDTSRQVEYFLNSLPATDHDNAGNRSLAVSEFCWKFDHAADCG